VDDIMKKAAHLGCDQTPTTTHGGKECATVQDVTTELREAKSVFAEWYRKIDAETRVKSVCKPCWEIKYCPYGPLVEQFPLPDEDKDSRRCRIFGHICPVFFVSEPFTETKELRNISRTISQPTRIRVLKRENQVCRKCNQPVAAEDIHFDHRIPWSKGGPSDEHNVQLLCSTCNRKKSASFEKEHLVDNFFDHVREPIDAEIIYYLDFCKVQFCCVIYV
jgi:hypothetical protein